MVAYRGYACFILSKGPWIAIGETGGGEQDDKSRRKFGPKS